MHTGAGAAGAIVVIVIVSRCARRVMIRRLTRQRVGGVSVLAGSVRSVVVVGVLRSIVLMRFLMEVLGIKMLVAVMMHHRNV